MHWNVASLWMQYFAFRCVTCKYYTYDVYSCNIHTSNKEHNMLLILCDLFCCFTGYSGNQNAQALRAVMNPFLPTKYVSTLNVEHTVKYNYIQLNII